MKEDKIAFNSLLEMLVRETENEIMRAEQIKSVGCWSFSFSATVAVLPGTKVEY